MQKLIFKAKYHADSIKGNTFNWFCSFPCIKKTNTYKTMINEKKIIEKKWINTNKKINFNRLSWNKLVQPKIYFAYWSHISRNKTVTAIYRRTTKWNWYGIRRNQRWVKLQNYKIWNSKRSEKSEIITKHALNTNLI